MITFFSVPKPWTGETARAQDNAVGSWRALGADVILFGDEEGIAEAGERLGAAVVHGLERNAHGTPLLDGVFARAHELARTDVLCFANADIVVTGELAGAAAAVARRAPRFVIVGESRDAALTETLDFAGDWQARVRAAARSGRRRGAGALDWFCFSRGVYESIPPFAVGRVGFDNWLVWHARDTGAAVVDATRVVRPVHQRHGYGHVPGGFEQTRRGAEAAENWRLAGGKRRIYTRFDASHLLTPRGLRRNLGATLRAKERLRKAIWKLRHGQLLPQRGPG
ncbi:MAG TPA: hypothetical protein VFA82_05760 [Gaiellaceae bacterium]|nr:hypothetical protein [Gaiellaceae bacterium]